MFKEKDVVYVISAIGYFVGEFEKIENNNLTIKHPVQIVSVPQQQGEQTFSVPVPVYLKMEKIEFFNMPFAVGKAPKDLEEKYWDVRAKESGLTIETDPSKIERVDFTKS